MIISDTRVNRIPNFPFCIASAGRDYFDFSLRSAYVWRRKWHTTPIFLPGECQGQRSVVGCRLWGLTEMDTTEAT